MRFLKKSILVAVPLITILILIVTACTPKTTEVEPTVAAKTEAPPPTEPPATAVPTEAPPEPTEPMVADELIIAIPEDLPSYDPYFAQGDLHTPAIVKMLFDNLVERDTEGKLVPGLAESWTWVDDTTLELKLRQNVTFHNGEEFNADDVKFTIERLLNPDNQIPVAWAYQGISSVEIVDSFTVQLKLKNIDSQLPNSLSTFLGILPNEYFNEVGAEEFGRAPVGTGPYVFVEHERDEYVTMDANPNYFEGSFKGKAIVPKLTFRFIPEVATRIAELETGTIDIAVDIPNDKVVEVDAIEGAHAVTGQGTIYYMLIFAFKDDVEQPFDDFRVRQALASATDVQAILDTVGGGYGTVLAGPFTENTTGYDPSLEPWPYDLESAQALLSDAGYADGFELTIDVAANVPIDIVQAVAGQWQEIGITVNVNPMEVGAFNEAWLGKKNNDMLAVAFNIEYEPTSFPFVWLCGAPISYYCNEDFTAAFTTGQGLLDDTARAEAFGESFKILHDDLPAVYLWVTAVHWGLSDKVTQFAHGTDGWIVSSLVEKMQ